MTTRPVLTPEPLTSKGLVFGQSATASGRNVMERLGALEMLCPFPGGVAADFGCGEGGYTIELAKRFNKVLAIDILPRNLECARQNVSGEAHFCCAALENIPVQSESVDVAFIIEVLDHVNDVGLTLSEVWRILKPRSRAYISVPNSLFPLETHPIKLFGKLLHPILFPCLNWTPFHDRIATARIFGRRKLIRMCESVGFRVLGSDFAVVPLERRFRPLRPVLAKVARTPLKPLIGVSLVLALEKNGEIAT
jgi:ubiquinone/menaquinone biosynthesis C-methylase UbiE